VLGFNLSFLFDKEELMETGLRQLIQWLEDGKLAPPRVTVYPFEQVGDAHRDLESGQTVGKLILRCAG
jgi:NADPH:quinone reductase-like Zn-dependent oxidoreductase